ncbi:MAG TPA: endonuclease/exonuclease/phosphatase family protein [Tepidisphaeraceae bacterium]|nr:endonuclease/exonuclease/phosphatase family protein [Tepidisphaeraceae bacterium]
MARRLRRSAEEQLADQIASTLLSTRQGRQFLLVAIIVGVITFGAYWLWQNQLRPRHPVGPTVRLATWNLRQFSESRKHVDLQRIAGIIRDNHFDLIAIQEVKRDGEEVDRLLSVLGSPWRAARFSDTSGNYERFAFIYNADHVQEIGTPHFIATTDAVIFDRTPYQDTFKAGNFAFTLIEVHLSYTNTTRRRQEAEALAHFAKRLKETSAEKDVIVCGDFNEQPPNGNLHYFLDQGWTSLNGDPTNLGSTEIYDTFLIDPQQTKQWNGVAGSVHFDEQLYGNDDKQAEEEISDHRPAYADFATN